jgi:hypothetical protein
MGFEPTVPANEWPQTYDLRYIGARNDTTQQSGQTPDKEVEIKNITVYVSGYTETDTTGTLSPPTVWRQQSEFVSSRQSGQIPAAVLELRTKGLCVNVSMDAHVRFTFWRRNYFFNFSTSCI